MEINQLFIRILILALPGLVGSLFYRKLRGGKDQKNWRDLAEITLFGLSSYAVYGTANELLSGETIALKALLNDSVTIRWSEVASASGVSVVIAVLASYADHFKSVNRFGRWISATDRYGDEDVWEYIQNSPDFSGWVFVRDHKLDLIYYGWVQLYSESGSQRELLLSDVEVYNNETQDVLYRVNKMYVSRDAYDFTIEFPAASTDQNDA